MPGHLASVLQGLPFTAARETVLSNTLDHGMAIETLQGFLALKCKAALLIMTYKTPYQDTTLLRPATWESMAPVAFCFRVFAHPLAPLIGGTDILNCYRF